MTTHNSASHNLVLTELRTLSSTEKAAHLARFFKTGKGQYGEGDLFLGVTVPVQREIAKRYKSANWAVMEENILSPWHEVRLTTLLILIEKYKCKEDKEMCISFYMKHLDRVNNWDLVDLSCYNLLGDWLQQKERSVLYALVASTNMWHQRIAMVTCMAFIRKNDFDDAFRIATCLLNHPHDLIHKAVGWLLREIGKRDEERLCLYLNPIYKTLPRTMLRYAIERFEESKRQAYLKGTI
ncbi:MAG: DNA alkylation repair protein [Marinifilaceae bacterium]